MATKEGSGAATPEKKMKYGSCTQNSSVKIPVFIVEDHNDALPRIYRLIGSKKLPMSQIKMIHFDSHPDLLLPKELLADDVFNVSKLYDELSIENWILPAFYAGHFSEITWVKPEWAHQIENGKYMFQIGKNIQTETIRVSCAENYFLSELLYCDPSELTHVKPIQLNVETLRSTETVLSKTGSKSPNTKRCTSAVEENQLTTITNHAASTSKQPVLQSYVLDIDLDFFSTTNPFINEYPGKQYSLIKKLYRYTPPVDKSEAEIQKCIVKRKKQLGYLKKVFGEMSSGREPHCGGTESDNLIRDLLIEIRAADDCNAGADKSDTGTSTDGDGDHCAASTSTQAPPRPKKVDFSWVHEVGCGVDDTDLPHHISTEEEITGLVRAAERYLARLPRPAAITVARSSEDEYCPPGQVESIQEQVLEMLRRVYGDLTVSKHYD